MSCSRPNKKRAGPIQLTSDLFGFSSSAVLQSYAQDDLSALTDVYSKCKDTVRAFAVARRRSSGGLRQPGGHV
eukprot:13433256-Heterocapsa_arctica.AAC.1